MMSPSTARRHYERIRQRGRIPSDIGIKLRRSRGDCYVSNLDLIQAIAKTDAHKALLVHHKRVTYIGSTLG